MPSRCIFAIHKEVIALRVIDSSAVPYLFQEPHAFKTDLAYYWVIPEVNWDTKSPDCRQIYKYFSGLNHWYWSGRSSRNAVKGRVSSFYGGIRIGSWDNDCEHFGDHNGYGLGIHRQFILPDGIIGKDKCDILPSATRIHTLQHFSLKDPPSQEKSLKPPTYRFSTLSKWI